jgi:hypothetical protein
MMVWEFEELHQRELVDAFTAQFGLVFAVLQWRIMFMEPL